MTKKIIGILLCVAVIASMLCVGSISANAQDGYTYYFLAPDCYFDTEAGAANTSVGVYWWEPNEPAQWPGVEMTPAPEVGTNVFKIEGVPGEVTNVIFNSFFYTDEDNGSAYQSVDVNTEGYYEDEAYEGCPVCTNFNGMIYVLDMNSNDDLSEYKYNVVKDGAWFTLDTYKDNETYYGSYGLSDDTDDTKYHAGDKVAAVMTVGSIAINGDPAKLGAYNYDIIYDPSTVTYIMSADLTTGGSFIYNDTYSDMVKLSEMAAYGVSGDFTGENAPAAVVMFEVKKDTDDLGIKGECTSLSAVSMDGSSMATLVGVYSPKDPYTSLLLDTDYTKYVNELPPTPDEEIANNVSEKEATDAPVYNDTDAAPNEDKAAADTDSKADTSSSASSYVTSPKTGTPTVFVIIPVMIMMAAAAMVMLSKREFEE